MPVRSLVGSGLQPQAYVIDDDRGVRTSLVTLLQASNIPTRPFASGPDLLEQLDVLSPGVLLIDVRLQAASGLDLLVELHKRDCYWPAVIMTGHAEIPLAVRAMELGAIAFLEKPFTQQAIDSAMGKGYAQLPMAVDKSERFKVARTLNASLSRRQREVFDGVVEGLTSKEIASRHGLSHRTVESYRIDMMNKLGGTSLLYLLELKAALTEIQGEP